MSGILIVDDDAALRSWARRILTAQGYTCAEAGGAREARLALRAGEFEVALVDVKMPGESGIELLASIRVAFPLTAVLMVTGEDDLGLATSAIELGAFGYLIKPVRVGELLINIANALHRRRREIELQRRVQQLAGDGRQMAVALRRALEAAEQAPNVVDAFQSDTLRRLVRLAEFRDDTTGHHMHRMSCYCELIGLQIGLPPERCATLRLASELHDVGKVAIPDRILLKPGKLTDEEFDVMKTHAEIGHRLFADSESTLQQLAGVIALTHHERWDGGGYPRGLAGEQIPLEGRIAAVADVFDALTSDRVYRPAFPVGLAVGMMDAERATHFDPELLDAMRARSDQVQAVRRKYPD
jgi:putative two-component system response regulator